MYAIVISYLFRSYAGRAKFWLEDFTTKILEAADQDCTREEDYIVWKRDFNIQSTWNSDDQLQDFFLAIFLKISWRGSE